MACPKTIKKAHVEERKVIIKKDKWLTSWPLKSTTNGKSHAIDEKLPVNELPH